MKNKLGVMVFVFWCASCATPPITLSNLTFVGQAEESSRVLIFTVDFDSEKPLENGVLALYLNDSLQEEQDLTNLMLMSNLSVEQHNGQLRFFINLSLKEPLKENITIVDIGIGIRTPDGDMSNIERMKFEISHDDS